MLGLISDPSSLWHRAEKKKQKNIHCSKEMNFLGNNPVVLGGSASVAEDVLISDAAYLKLSCFAEIRASR